MILAGVMLIFDILWLSTSGSNWGERDTMYVAWNSTASIKTMAVVFSVLNVLFKVQNLIAEFYLNLTVLVLTSWTYLCIFKKEQAR